MKINYKHNHAAHCESGVASGLLSFYQGDVSEAMAFGVGSGLFFGYIPFMKIEGGPMTFYRGIPGGILKKAATRLGMKIKTEKFRSPKKAMDELNRVLDAGTPVALQAGIFWLPYFPDALRFHFNAHHLVVYGRAGNKYFLSDPVLDEPVECSASDLETARFAHGPLAPHGKMIYLEKGNPHDVSQSIRSGLKETISNMLGIPFPLVGVRGIRTMKKHILKWPRKFNPRIIRRYFAHIVRMQEEIGTGGAGFRFLFAAFLQEAADLLKDDRLRTISDEVTQVGDRWRDFGVLAVRKIKSDEDIGSLDEIASVLDACADKEEIIYKKLKMCLKSAP